MVSPKHQIDIKTAFSEKIESSFAALLPYGRQKSVSKGTFIVEQNELCNKLFLVQDGVFRTYRETNDVEYTTGFSFRGDFDTSPFSFYYGLPATETIEAITSATILVFDRQDFWNVTRNNIDFQKGVYLLLAGYIELLENRLHENRSMTAEERYIHLRASQPEEVKKIPLHFIASYLGITKERLSRIRKKIA
ncbi:Crp/Fnr family transcriptional regulator [Fibrella sp. HMF5335]|uniref:Crp/Fnr family transcriptional regulator n=1 Tax=Fibrella rubiginis TaxID=2817060 RepID=A0A939GEJ0_9BACT|nr:Crp/Fnr family transcriptional regulator [Fibrella rubiginis]MBO0935759.1 Crp/Fnr family transcriptional regulator [Fibrella rubiginis]